MNKILVLGGLDDTQKTVLDYFTNYSYELNILRFLQNDEMYVCNPKSAMQTGRGCFSVTIKDGFVYVFGGVTGKNLNYKNDRQGNERGVYHDGEDNVGLLSLCEKYDVSDDQWYEISETPYPIKNAGACALSSDSIFLFGGQTNADGDDQLSNTILQYIIASNVWLELPLRLPVCMSLITSMKINNFQIALFGGLSSQDKAY